MRTALLAAGRWRGWVRTAATLACAALGAPCALGAGVPLSPPATGGPADLVLLHGRIHTQDAARRIVQALAVRGPTILAAGSDAEVQRLSGTGTRVVDLHNRVVLPGLIDAHIHPAESSRDLDKCNLEDRMLDPPALRREVRRCLAREPAQRPPWLEVVGVDVSQLTLTRQQLDDMLPRRPLLLEDASGHTLFANSAALAAAHVDARSKDPPGGRIERDASGAPTGTLRDSATELLLDARPAPDRAHESALLAKALDGMRSCGLTSVQDADANEHYMLLYERLYDAHQLRMRVRASFGLKDTDRPAQQLIAEARAFRERWAIDPDYLRADAIKIFADGVIENPSHTAALLEPYLDAAGRPTADRGPTYYAPEHLNEVVAAADAADFTVHVHAIGDRAVRSALDAFAYARERNGPRDNRHQIAHLELIHPADFPRFRQLGVIANFQLLWAESDVDVLLATIPYLGEARSRYLYPARSLLDAGALIAGGSDWNVSSYNPFEAMEHAITRAEHRGGKPLHPEESLPLQAIVDAYTINAAVALRQERSTGSLEPGKRADFVVLDRDIFALDPFELHATRVLQTYLDGEVVYRAARSPSLQPSH